MSRFTDTRVTYRTDEMGQVWRLVPGPVDLKDAATLVEIVEDHEVCPELRRLIVGDREAA